MEPSEEGRSMEMREGLKEALDKLYETNRGGYLQLATLILELGEKREEDPNSLDSLSLVGSLMESLVSQALKMEGCLPETIREIDALRSRLLPQLRAEEKNITGVRKSVLAIFDEGTILISRRLGCRIQGEVQTRATALSEYIPRDHLHSLLHLESTLRNTGPEPHSLETTETLLISLLSFLRTLHVLLYTRKLSKTSGVCYDWKNRGYCTRPNCNFSHDVSRGCQPNSSFDPLQRKRKKEEK